MKTLLLFIFCFMLISINQQEAFAGKHRVNNNPEMSAEFTDIQAAINASSPGDTLYIEGSHYVYEYSSIVVDIPLTILGPGYFLEENDSTTVDKLSAQIDASFVFSEGASGSKLSGLYLNNGRQIKVQTGELTISRNRLDANIDLDVQADQVYILQNYWEWGGLGILSDYVSANVFILNNIYKFNVGGIYLTEYSTGAIENNLLMGGLTVSNSTIRNNICWGDIWISNNTVSNNFENINPEDFFLLTGSPDGQYQLKPGSPAIGAGYDGTDCGAFGGVAPYFLSGLPPVPHIYEAYVAVIGSNDDGLQVNIKAKTQN